jgi:hypothetical protein
VAESKTTLEQIGLTRGKAALIGVLALMLGGVVYRQIGGSDEHIPAVSSAAPAQQAPANQPAPANAVTPVSVGQPTDASLESALAELDQTKWQSPDLNAVIAYDPFALPSSFPQPQLGELDPTLAAEGGDATSAAQKAQELAEAVEAMQVQLVELQERGVHVIVNLNDEYVAMIGDRTVHVGDEINGFVVTAIEPDGVRVERKTVQ